MGWFSSKEDKQATLVPWKKLTDSEQLNEILGDRLGKKNILFKHSTRCSISALALNKFQNDWSDDIKDVEIWFLDLLNFREISNEIAEKTGVIHQSPQAISLENGEVKYYASHSEINLQRAIKSFEA